jgi:23S rRNA pseudouridine1911/1915/1917 synthase
VKIDIPEHLRLAETAPPSEDLVVLYEDESVIAVDKPPMLVVHPSGRHLTDTLIQRVHAVYKSERLHRDARPRLCHRLDRETSGIVLIGKDPESHQDLMRQFEQREVEKEYLAIVHGAPQFDSGVVDLPLGQARASSIRLKMAVVSDGLESQTEWSVVRLLPGRTLIACRPKTGRQHQIRVHMDAIGHPLVGDKLYGLDEQIFQRSADGELTGEDMHELELPRHALHNHSLTFAHPRTGGELRIECPLAPDLRVYLDRRALSD